MINKRLIVFITSILFLLASCTNTSPKPIANDDSAFSSATEQDSSEQETPELEIFVDAPDTVLSGDEFTITFTVNDDARKFDRPSFDGFSFLGQSSQSLNINGNKSTSISYTLVSNQEGSFEIGPASCISNGKKITSSKFTINVVKPTATQQKQREKQQKQLQQQQLQQLRQIQQQQRSLIDQFDQLLNTNPLRQQPSFSEPENTKDIIFVRSFLSSTNPYQGEQTIITHKLYYDPRISIDKDYNNNSPNKKGFWTEELTTSAGYETEIVNGHSYRVKELCREALFPLENGTLAIDPSEITVDILDPPFAIRHTMLSNPLNVNVNSLPSPPDDFSNGIGQFTIKGGLSLDSVHAGDPVSYKLTVSGRGNLTLITPPDPLFPESFATDNPKLNDDIVRATDGISGSRTYEWALIPRDSGTFTIPAYQFIYFNPASGKYTTLTIAPQTITVLPNSISGHSNNQAITQPNNFFSYLLYILSALALILIIVVLTLWLRKKNRTSNVDPVAQRKRNALTIAQRRLKKAHSHMSKNETETFYQEIYHAIWGCLSDKYSIPTSQLNRDTVTTCLQEKQVSEEQLQRIHQLLNAIDLARFAPVTHNPQGLMQNIYQQTLEVLTNYEL